MTDTLLKVENIKAHYGSVEAIRGVSIDVEEGKISALIGANGAGKTTLLRVISGLIKPTSGQILFHSIRIDGFPPQSILARGISHVPEGRQIFPYMTVYENLKMGGFIQKDKLQFKKDLTMVYQLFPELEKKSRQAGGTLSGGQQQMLAIGRALMSNPKVLLMDEPTIGLSPLLVKILSRTIDELSHQGISILLVEQNIKMAFEICKMCSVMETGSITLSGPAEDLVNDERVKENYLGG
jgi:branched-chain amino acid transport system ATP-binding protein